MKGKELKELVNKIHDNDEVLFEYSGLLFGMDRSPELFKGKKQVKHLLNELCVEDDKMIEQYNCFIEFHN